jgi:hypothetical protein
VNRQEGYDERMNGWMYLCQIFSNMRQEVGEMSARNFDKPIRELSLNFDKPIKRQILPKLTI